mmetsp:Transcript_6293/g.13512  ORF Transcript_6293/g.13512 Transcript_6293/m.13512 type:complete len:208 (-) Transcript_6293:1296-1919(-)
MISFFATDIFPTPFAPFFAFCSFLEEECVALREILLSFFVKDSPSLSTTCTSSSSLPLFAELSSPSSLIDRSSSSSSFELSSFSPSMYRFFFIDACRLGADRVFVAERRGLLLLSVCDVFDDGDVVIVDVADVVGFLRLDLPIVKEASESLSLSFSLFVSSSSSWLPFSGKESCDLIVFCFLLKGGAVAFVVDILEKSKAEGGLSLP